MIGGDVARREPGREMSQCAACRWIPAGPLTLFRLCSGDQDAEVLETGGLRIEAVGRVGVHQRSWRYWRRGDDLVVVGRFLRSWVSSCGFETATAASFETFARRLAAVSGRS